MRVAEHAGWDAVRADIEAFLADHVRTDGTYAIQNPFRYAMSAPVASEAPAGGPGGRLLQHQNESRTVTKRGRKPT